MTHRGHPVEAPTAGQPTQADRDLMQPLDQMRLVLALALSRNFFIGQTRSCQLV
jgi:hypothetical protein